MKNQSDVFQNTVLICNSLKSIAVRGFGSALHSSLTVSSQPERIIASTFPVLDEVLSSHPTAKIIKRSAMILQQTSGGGVGLFILLLSNIISKLQTQLNHLSSSCRSKKRDEDIIKCTEVGREIHSIMQHATSLLRTHSISFNSSLHLSSGNHIIDVDENTFTHTLFSIASTLLSTFLVRYEITTEDHQTPNIHHYHLHGDKNEINNEYNILNTSIEQYSRDLVAAFKYIMHRSYHHDSDNQTGSNKSCNNNNDNDKGLNVSPSSSLSSSSLLQLRANFGKLFDSQIHFFPSTSAMMNLFHDRDDNNQKVNNNNNNNKDDDRLNGDTIIRKTCNIFNGYIFKVNSSLMINSSSYHRISKAAMIILSLSFSSFFDHRNDIRHPQRMGESGNGLMWEIRMIEKLITYTNTHLLSTSYHYKNNKKKSRSVKVIISDRPVPFDVQFIIFEKYQIRIIEVVNSFPSSSSSSSSSTQSSFFTKLQKEMRCKAISDWNFLTSFVGDDDRRVEGRKTQNRGDNNNGDDDGGGEAYYTMFEEFDLIEEKNNEIGGTLSETHHYDLFAVLHFDDQSVNSHIKKEGDGGGEREIKEENGKYSVFVPSMVIYYDITDSSFKSELSSIVKQIFYSFYALLEDRCYVKGGGEAEVEVGNSLPSSIDARFENSNYSSSRLKSIWKIGGSAVAESLIEVGKILLHCEHPSHSFEMIDCFRTKAQVFNEVGVCLGLLLTIDQIVVAKPLVDISAIDNTKTSVSHAKNVSHDQYYDEDQIQLRNKARQLLEVKKNKLTNNDDVLKLH